jgi:hypothetical protein
MKTTRIFRTGLAAILAGACAQGGAQPVEVEQRDSAGVRIMESRGPSAAATSGSAAVRLSAQPLAQIGVVEGAPEYQLDRVQWLTRLSDGTIVVANGGSSELRFYDGTGRYLFASGRTGAGPGEYRGITYLRRLAGDTLLVYDAFNRRLSWVSGSGAHVRDVADGPGQPQRVVAALEDGTLLSTAPRPSRPPADAEFMRDTMAYQVVRGDARLPVDGLYVGSERRMQLGEQAGGGMTIQLTTLPFARNVLTGATRDHFVVGSNYSYELHLIDAAGALRTIIRRPDVVPQPVTPELIDRFVAVQLAQRGASGGEADEEAARRRAHAYQRVEAVPAYERIVAAANGQLWVKDWAPPAIEGATERWSIFAADGALRGGVDVPFGYRPLYVDDDVVIGVIRDEYDVEYVRVYALDG